MAPYTIGSFQYFLLYICPQPGKIADLIAALRGLWTVTFFIFVPGAAESIVAVTVLEVSEETITSFFCAKEVLGSIARQVNKRNIFTKTFLFLIFILFRLSNLEIHLLQYLVQFILGIIVNDDLPIAIAAVL